jgi:hypothetical protein
MHDLTNCNIVNTPLPDGLILSPHDCPPINEVDRELQSKYRSIVGSLMFAALYWRPDICYSVGHLSRFLHIPGTKHLKAAKHILRYLKATKGYGITFKRDYNANTNSIKPRIVSTCDANFGGD